MKSPYDPNININLKGKTIMKVLASDDFQSIDTDENDSYNLTAGSILIELDDGSFIKFWTSEWGGITIVNKSDLKEGQ
jgi:hypothetical protein